MTAADWVVLGVAALALIGTGIQSLANLRAQGRTTSQQATTDLIDDLRQAVDDERKARTDSETSMRRDLTELRQEVGLLRRREIEWMRHSSACAAEIIRTGGTVPEMPAVLLI